MSARVFAVAVLILAGVIIAVMLFERGERPALVGKIRGVTFHGTTPEDTLAVLDVELTNSSQAPFEVSHLEGLAGRAQGDSVAMVDAERLIKAYPALAAQGIPPLMRVGDTLQAGASARRALMLAFPGLSAEEFQTRRPLRLKIQEQAGHVATLTETK